MDVIKIIIFLILALFFSTFIYSKKHVNLLVIVYGLISLFIILIGIYCFYYVIRLIIIMNFSIWLTIFILSLGLLLLFVQLYLLKIKIYFLLKLFDYYIHKNKAFKYGRIEKGIIVDIKREGYARYGYHKRYYLVVNLNGEHIKSNIFSNNIYKIGDSIDILVYKKHKYVILEKKIFVKIDRTIRL